MRRRFTVQPPEVRQYYRDGYLLKKRFIPEHLLKDPEFTHLLEYLNLWKAMSVLLGSQHLTYHFSNLTINISEHGSMPCGHREFTNQPIPFVASDFLNAFIPLTKPGYSNGAPTIIRGSNRVTDKAVKLSRKLSRGTIKMFPQARSLYCAPGDIIFIHPKTLFRAEQENSPLLKSI